MGTKRQKWIQPGISLKSHCRRSRSGISTTCFASLQFSTSASPSTLGTGPHLHLMRMVPKCDGWLYPLCGNVPGGVCYRHSICSASWCGTRLSMLFLLTAPGPVSGSSLGHIRLLYLYGRSIFNSAPVAGELHGYNSADGSLCSSTWSLSVFLTTTRQPRTNFGLRLR